jgi:osmotically-inducible protein OsmY
MAKTSSARRARRASRKRTRSFTDPYTPLYSGRQAAESHAGKAPRGYVRSSERIHDDVCERLTRHPGVDPSNVTVAVADGVVKLTGHVTDERTLRLVEATARDVTGVREVQNQLVVAR